MPRPMSHSPLMRPFVALALPGMYLVYRYNQYRRQQQEANKRKAAEKELVQLNHKIDKLLTKLDEHEPELAMTQEEECVICVNAKATMQTFPCGHRVVCRKCFVKTIQVAVSQRLLPLRCVVCRAKILRLRQSRDGPFPSSVSQYSMSSYGSSSHPQVLPASHSLYSFTSGSSGFSGVSSVSSASSESGGSVRGGNAMRSTKAYRQGTRNQMIKKVKVTSKSGARDKEPLKGELPQIRIDNYDVIPVRFVPITRSPRVIIRENKVAPQDINGRLPTIKEYGEFISEREIEIDKSSSTRIRCAQKLVNQLESNNNNTNNNNNINTTNNNNDTNNNKNKNNNNLYQPNLKVPILKVISGTPSPPRKVTPIIIPSSKSSTSIKSTTSSSSKTPTGPSIPHAKSFTADKRFNNNKYTSFSGAGGGAGGPSGKKTGGGGSGPVKSSSVGSKLTSYGGKSNFANFTRGSYTSVGGGSGNGSSNKGVKSADRRDSSSSSISLKHSPSITSNISIISNRSNGSIKSGSSSKSSSSYKSATSNSSSTKSSTSSFSTSSTVTIKSCRSLIPASLRKDSQCQKGVSKEREFDAIMGGSSPKHELVKSKSLTKRFEGREYQRLQ